jgi:cob(I)alamin adenosyltransferase
MLGLTQIFYGNGKGKTTAALGTALRACGNGFHVHLIQFMKNGAQSLEEQIPGEIKALEKFSTFSWKRFGAGDWIIKSPGPEHIKSVEEALTHLQKTLNSPDSQIIIADEILYAVQLGCLPQEKLVDLIKNKPKEKELILTGSHKPFPKIFELADLVTEVKKEKHPYDQGILARKGIEY